MKNLFTLLLVTISSFAWAQSFKITGDIEKDRTISMSDLQKMKSQKLDSIQIFNHKMEYKSTLSGLKAVALSDILKDVELKEKSPKFYSHYYIEAIAEDDYKVVFSWNEIFNSNTKIYILTQKDNKDFNYKDLGFSLVTPSDIATGRRFVKDLKTIRFRKI